jgi:hypothetical protein
MLTRGSRRLTLVVGPLLLLGYLSLRLCYNTGGLRLGVEDWVGSALHPSGSTKFNNSSQQDNGRYEYAPTYATQESFTIPADAFETHNEVFSASTLDRKFFHLKFGDQRAMNPNILPHPLADNHWIIVAQQYKAPGDRSNLFSELVCSAIFGQHGLECTDLPTNLPIAATTGSNKCQDKLDFISMNVGPHDARVFYGPHIPYTVYGSNSMYTCFGQWIQDLRTLLPWGLDMVTDKFTIGTELQRPNPYFPIEKNWFIFWDTKDQAYLHFDVAPKRVFAKLENNGSVGLDIATFAAPNDERCTKKYMPTVATTIASIHQSTNSLSITLCKRVDPLCQQSQSNTFVFTIFQHKTFYNFHSEYEPYVLAFSQQTPFKIYGISKKPIWIYGRMRNSETSSQMFYVMSMSWKANGQKYHGYLDDILFLSFGIEDEDTGAIDVAAEDLFREGLDYAPRRKAHQAIEINQTYEPVMTPGKHIQVQKTPTYGNMTHWGMYRGQILSLWNSTG